MSSLRNVRLLSAFNFFIYFKLYSPITLIYFAQVSGSYALGAGISSIVMLSSAALEVPTGVFSDRLGRVAVTRLGAVTMALALVAYALAPSFPVLLIGALLEGLSMALYSGNNQALLYDTLVDHGMEEDYAHHAGRIASMLQLALAISGLIGGFVAAMFSLRAAVAISIAPQVGSIIVTYLMREPNTKHAGEGNAFGHVLQAFKKLKANKNLRRMVIAGGAQHAAGETAFKTQPAYIATLWPTWAIGVARMMHNGLAFLSFRLSGAMLRRFGAGKSLLLSQIWANAVNLIAIAKATPLSPVAIVAEGLSFGVATTAQDTLQQKEFSDSERATMASIGSLIANLLYAVALVVTGFVADKFGLRWGLLCCQLFGLAALPIVWMVHRTLAAGDLLDDGLDPSDS